MVTVAAVFLLFVFLFLVSRLFFGFGLVIETSSVATSVAEVFEYSPVRVIVGVGLSLGLVAAAVWVVRSTTGSVREGDPFVEPRVPEGERRSDDA